MSDTSFDRTEPGARTVRHRFPWLALLAAAVVVPLLLAAVAVLVGRESVQDDLGSRSEAALAEAGLADAVVSFDGRDATVRGVASDQVQTAETVVGSIDGVRTVAVDADDAAATATPTTSGSTTDVPSTSTTEPATPLAPPPAPPGPDKAAVQQQINGSLAAAPITFAPDSNRLTAVGTATIALVADVLRTVPEVRVQVAGHIADTPGPDPNAQALSDQRAGAVRNELIRLGIAPERIDAVGYGTSRPVAPNDTSAGQAANRRVEVIVL